MAYLVITIMIFGTLKSIVMDLNIGKFNILWGGLENKWESYYLKNDIKSITQRININIEKAPSDFLISLNKNVFNYSK